MRLAALAVLAACGTDPPPVEGTVCGELGVRPTQCGRGLELVPVNHYDGAAATVVAQREDAVALIGGSCTGTLIAAAAGPVVLTAGHCGAVGDRALVAFNVEVDPDGDALVTEGTILESFTEPDYALLRLDQLPAVTPTPLSTRTGQALAIIQHPRGGPKVVADGALLGTCGDELAYDLDTLVGSSGAGVLGDGFLIAVHSDGDCTESGGGANRGWTVASILSASAYLAPGDAVP